MPTSELSIVYSYNLTFNIIYIGFERNLGLRSSLIANTGIINCTGGGSDGGGGK